MILCKRLHRKTGFENSAYFSKKFKEIIGTTPMAYLKKQRGVEE